MTIVTCFNVNLHKYRAIYSYNLPGLGNKDWQQATETRDIGQTWVVFVATKVLLSHVVVPQARKKKSAKKHEISFNVTKTFYGFGR